jgi:hypothetical protein
LSAGQPQLLGLLGPLLGPTLPRLRPLEGGTVLLELRLCRGERRLPLRRYSLCRGQVLTCLLMRLVSFQERVLHHVDRGGALCRLGALVLKLVPHGPQPVLQPPVVGPQGLHEGVEGVVLILVPIALGACRCFRPATYYRGYPK